jgi:hypothetical protein
MVRDGQYDSIPSGALDLGVALLVKTLPLARIATSYSCDGHGEREAFVWLAFDWDDLWGEAVFKAIVGDTPNSIWVWSDRKLSIAPRGGYGDTELFGMLSDIQRFARSLLHQPTIDKIGRARTRTLGEFGKSPPDMKRFSEIAHFQLSAEFA